MSDRVPLPSDSDLRRMVLEGWTHAQITEECERVTGQRLHRATISSALSRALLTASTGNRYFECIPWRVRPEHQSAYPARMLRLLGRRTTGVPLAEADVSLLDSWLAMLEHERVIVAYSPATEDGFQYVDEKLRGGPHPELPIRVQVLAWDEAPPTHLGLGE